MTTIKAFTVAGLRGVRGARTLNAKSRGLLLGGDNGTGKSSLIQGLSLALTGKLGTAAGVEMPEEYVRHQREDDDAKHVVIDLLPRGHIELRGNGAPDCDAEGKAFRDACVRAAPFLRRDELLRVVNQKDTERREYFEGFMDLGAVYGLESALRERRIELNRACDAAKGQLEARLSAWARVLRAPVSTTAELRGLLIGRAKEAGVDVAPRPDWKTLTTAIRNAVQRAAVSPARRLKVEGAFERAENLVPPDHPKTALAALRKAESAATDAAALDLLHEALRVLKAQGSAEPCPVCEQTIEKRALTKRLKERISAMDGLTTLHDAVHERAKEWTVFLCDLRELERFIAPDATGPAAEHEPLGGREMLERLAANPRLSLECQGRMDMVRTKLAAMRRAIPTETQAARLTELQQAVRNGEDLPGLEQSEQALALQQGELARYRAVEQAISSARKSETKRIMQEVEVLVRGFYGRIHRGSANEEPTGAPRVVMHDHGKGAARLRGEFDGEEVEDVRCVYSDGHQDTVGLAFFLALRRSRADREGDDPKLMVLDDIVGSIDAGHFDRFLEVLRDEFHDHQIVLASHNALLLARARTLLPGVSTEMLAGWTLAAGPELRKHTLPREELRQKLETAGDPAELARALAPTLEPTFRALCTGFAVSIPYGQDDLSVGDYWPPLKKKLGDLAKEALLPTVADEVAAIDAAALFRNGIGSHDNPAMLAGAALGPVKRAAEALLRLIDKLSCSNCAGLVRFRNRRERAAGLACQCPRSAAPKLSCQTGAAPGVGES